MTKCNGDILTPENILPGGPLRKQEEIITACREENLYGLFQELQNAPIESEQDFLSFYEDTCLLATFSRIDTRNLVLFSGHHCKEEAEKYINKNPHYDTLHTRPAGVFLDSLEQKIGDKELFYMAGYIAALRVANETKASTIKTFLNGANDTTTFRLAELWELAANPGVQTINGKPVTNFTPLMAPHLMDWFSNLQNAEATSLPTNKDLCSKFQDIAQKRCLSPETRLQAQKIALKFTMPLLRDLKNATSIPDHLRQHIPV